MCVRNEFEEDAGQDPFKPQVCVHGFLFYYKSDGVVGFFFYYYEAQP